MDNVHWTGLEMTQVLDFYFQICWINEKELSNLITDSSSFRDRICRALENPRLIDLGFCKKYSKEIKSLLKGEFG